MSKRICVVGTGYVGMACCIGLAMLGHRVAGYDILNDRIARLRRGLAPYREDGLDELLLEQMRSGRLSFEDSLESASAEADVVIVAVGTPSREDGSSDLSALHAATSALAKVPFASRPLVAIRSTCPPGTSDAIARVERNWADVVYVPEFLREGHAVRDFLDPDRIVIGASDASLAERFAALVAGLAKPVVVTTRVNAEMIKACSNAYLALKISYANEIANLCDAVGAVADDVLAGIGADRRIGADFLQPGIGFGGPCFEKDLKSMAHVARAAGVDNRLFETTLRINDAQPLRIVRMIEDAVRGDLESAEIGVWGLTFKAGTNDTRDSLAVRIVRELSARGATLRVFDPAIRVAPLPPRARLVASALEAADADVLAVLTDWPAFAGVDPRAVAKTLRRGAVIDGRNLLDGAAYAAAGCSYRGVGRPQFATSPSSALSRAM